VLNSRDPALNWADDESDCVCRAGYERMINSLCTACAVGKFRSDNQTRYCQLCPVDTYQNSIAQLACVECPQHSSTLSHVGSNTVLHCVCAAGFQPMTLAGLCTPCAPGTYRSHRFANESDAQCVACPENHYCPEGSIDPISCPTGELEEAGAYSLQQCQCPAGSGRYSAQNCTLCPRGYYSMTSSNAECSQCPTNKTTVYVGAYNQSDCVCVPGHGIVDDLPSSPCTLCPETAFAQGYKNEPCTSCGWGALSFTRIQSESCQCNTQKGLYEV
jgi:hypothetical protein